MSLLELLKTKINYTIARRKFICIMVLLLLFVPPGLSGQFQTSAEESEQLIPAFPGEKVYLHLDRPNYMQGDTIWFKAYSWYGYDQVPDTFSRVLYVDLVSPESGVELNRKLLIQNGTSQGDFRLDKNITPVIVCLGKVRFQFNSFIKVVKRLIISFFIHENKTPAIICPLYSLVFADDITPKSYVIVPDTASGIGFY